MNFFKSLTAALALSLTGCSTFSILEEPLSDCEEASEETAVDETSSESYEIGQQEEDSLFEEEVSNCSFEVETIDGLVTMRNSLKVSLAQGVYYGPSDPGVSELLRIHISVEDPDCEGMTVEMAEFLTLWTDNASTEWTPEFLWVTSRTNGEVLDEVEVTDTSGVVITDMDLRIEIQGGESHVISLYGITYGASEVDDDAIQAGLLADSLIVSDSETTVTLSHEDFSGGVIVF